MTTSGYPICDSDSCEHLPCKDLREQEAAFEMYGAAPDDSASWAPVEVLARTPGAKTTQVYHCHSGTACVACEMLTLRAHISLANARGKPTVKVIPDTTVEGLWVVTLNDKYIIHARYKGDIEGIASRLRDALESRQRVTP